MRLLSAVLAAALLLSGCGGIQGTAPAPPPSTLNERLVDGNTAFGFSLLQRLRSEAPDQNLFLSPASISLALAMAYNGAEGETRQSMAQTLALDGVDREAVNQANQDLLGLLANPDPKVELSIANAIWYKQDLKVNPAFAEVVQDQYKAELQGADFAGPAAAKAINQWASQQTRGKIPTVVERTSPMDRMYLVNAVYFNGKWQEPFDPNLTHPRPFQTADGASHEVPMMTQVGRFRYLQGDGFAAAALPYGEGRISLYLFVPDDVDGLGDLIARLTPQQWDAWMGRFEPHKGAVTLPKVKLEYKAQLKEPLIAMGMGPAFTPGQADFSGLFSGSTEDLFISSVLHKTFLEMDEEGTEAAAVTAVAVAATSAGPGPEPFSLVADRPYLIAIRDDQTGTILFVGAIVDPR